MSRLLGSTHDLPLARLLDESNDPQIGRISPRIEFEMNVLREGFAGFYAADFGQSLHDPNVTQAAAAIFAA